MIVGFSRNKHGEEEKHYSENSERIEFKDMAVVNMSSNIIMKDDKWKIIGEKFGIKRVSHIGARKIIQWTMCLPCACS